MSKSIALLVCDRLLPDVFGEHGYNMVFSELLQGSAKALGFNFTDKCKLVEYDVTKMEYPPLDATHDGMLITGSKASAYEDVPWINELVAFVARAAQKPELKIVGICFGHQILARALEGRCVRNDGRWEVGPTKIGLTDLGKKVFDVESDSLYIQEMHQDHVPELPPNFHLLGSTEVALNQGMVRFNPGTSSFDSLADIQIFAVQGHPEFNESIMTELVTTRAASGVLNAATAADAIRRAKWQNDGVEVVGKTILGVCGVTP
ncbi:class I glutamine amidotransferase-like protein [Mycena epipterygia]|nr:class I glutamine amidotransferase-like protein [Mycena epipterygia]